ncbi:MAG: cadherin repeat domain-containing protein, partial [Ekhidna sp.]|nr:cadherin repeat domain-containing protein [Ekhidna sp.]
TVNTAPTIADQTFSVVENTANGTAVGTVQASDAETNNLMFSITQGNTGDVFDINQNTGAITTAGALDFETDPTYTLTISVSDGSLSATADITVSVTNVNDNAPTIAGQTFSVAEDAANNTEVGTVQAADADMDNLTFTITSGNTGDVFDINRTTGVITKAASLDFGTTPNYITIYPAADFTVSSTNNTINVPGYANVYTVDVETTLTNWTITSSNNAIIPDAEIQKLSNTRFLMVVNRYFIITGSNSRAIRLTVSGMGGDDLTITVNQTRNTVTAMSPNILEPFVGVIANNSYFVIEYQQSSTQYSVERSILDTRVQDFVGGSGIHNTTVSVSPASNIRLRDNNPRTASQVFFHLTPPSGSTSTYAIITFTSETDPKLKENFVIILRPPSGGTFKV